MMSEYIGIHLKPLEITTSTIAYDSDIRMSYQDLSKYIHSDGVRILAVKSTCIPLQKCLDNPYTKASKIIKKRERNKSKEGANKQKQSRTLSGNTLYFNSSVEFVVRDNPEDTKYYNIRISPSKGSIQIQGVKPPIFEVANNQIRFILDHISEKMCTEDVYNLTNCRVIIINEKTEIKAEDDVFIRIDELSKIFSNYIATPEEMEIESPFPILYVDNEFEVGSYIRVKFLTSIDNNPNRKTTVKIFSGRKINILGCPNTEAPTLIYKFLDKIIDSYKNRLFLKKNMKEKDIDDILDEIVKLRENKLAWVGLIR